MASTPNGMDRRSFLGVYPVLTMIGSPSATNLDGTTLTSPPSEGSVASGPLAPPNTTAGTMGNQIPDPGSLSGLLDRITINSPHVPYTGTQSAPPGKICLSFTTTKRWRRRRRRRAAAGTRQTK